MAPSWGHLGASWGVLAESGGHLGGYFGQFAGRFGRTTAKHVLADVFKRFDALRAATDCFFEKKQNSRERADALQKPRFLRCFSRFAILLTSLKIISTNSIFGWIFNGFGVEFRLLGKCFRVLEA